MSTALSLRDERCDPPDTAPAVPAAFDALPPLAPEKSIRIPLGTSLRSLSIYTPRNAFALGGELDGLADRAVDRNIFFAPQFLLPAMPRLDDRAVKLMVGHDGASGRSHIRFAMPYVVERAGLIAGPPTIRAWTHPFGPLGTPLVDADNATAIVAGVLSALTRPELELPRILVLPGVRMDQPFAAALTDSARSLGLPMLLADHAERAALVRGPGSDAIGAPGATDGKVSSELRRQRHQLERSGTVSFGLVSEPAAMLAATEEFLLLEDGEGTGRSGVGFLGDRYRAAFAREAIMRLAERGRSRIYSLRVNDKAVASLVVLVDGPDAFLWKTGCDRTYAAASPGPQLMVHASEALLDDPAIQRIDSVGPSACPFTDRFWSGRIRVATFVIGLDPRSGSQAAAAARGLDRVQAVRNATRLVRRRFAGVS